MACSWTWTTRRSWRRNVCRGNSLGWTCALLAARVHRRRRRRLFLLGYVPRQPLHCCGRSSISACHASSHGGRAVAPAAVVCTSSYPPAYGSSQGKTLIHPKQIAVANQVFAPSAEEVALSRRMISAHAEVRE
jgi:citrate lyase beta subunit